jgi:type IX secretion system PorP/SprF family membrane protein
MKHYCLILAVVVWLVYIQHLQAQTPQFTQFYHAPMAMNPAFAGTIAQCRLGLLHRQQWLGATARVATTYAAFDANIPAVSGGLGAYLTHDVAPIAHLQQITLQGVYSFQVRINRQYVLRMGLNAGIAHRTTALNALRFTSQVRADEPDVFEGNGSNSRFFVDIGSGLLFYSEKFWAGASVLHLNQPDISFLTGEFAALPRLYAAHVGGKFSLPTDGSGDIYLMPALLFKQQRVARQLDIGLRVAFERFPLQLGVQYRGLPLIQSFGLPQQEALAAIIGIYRDNWQMAYSYDLPISNLNRVTSGSHEIGIVYTWATRRFRRQMGIKCPVF